MTRQFFADVLAGFALSAVIGAILLLASIASAQDSVTVDAVAMRSPVQPGAPADDTGGADNVAGASSANDATVLILAQACVAEADWNERDQLDDHNMILHTLRRGAERRGVPLQQHALEYVAAFDPRTRSPRATWIRSLNLQATKPDGWPLNIAWSAHVTWWIAIIDKARAFLADPSSVPDPCPTARGWAGTTDRLRGRMVPARCASVRPGRRIANTPYRLVAR